MNKIIILYWLLLYYIQSLFTLLYHVDSSNEWLNHLLLQLLQCWQCNQVYQKFKLKLFPINEQQWSAEPLVQACGKIAVLVVDGNYFALCALGFPLPALAAMQEAGVQLGQACWDVKQSTSGLSLSFFWPQNSRQTQLSSTQKITKSKKRRRRRKTKDKTNDLTKNKHPDVRRPWPTARAANSHAFCVTHRHNLTLTRIITSISHAKHGYICYVYMHIIYMCHGRGRNQDGVINIHVQLQT